MSVEEKKNNEKNERKHGTKKSPPGRDFPGLIDFDFIQLFGHNCRGINYAKCSALEEKWLLKGKIYIY